jgi:ribonuclease HI
LIYGIEEAVEVEARGIMEAISDLDRFRNDGVINETDNITVVKAVQSRWYPRSYWGQIARKVREKLHEATLIF